MREKSFTQELFVSGVLILLLIIVIFHNALLMPKNFENVIVFVLVAAYLFFIGLVWKEKPQDERESLHILSASRFSFLVGLSILLVGVTIQSLNHTIDPWLAATLLFMIIAKVSSRIWNEHKN